MTYLVTRQAKLIEEGSWYIFAKLFQCFHIHINVWRSIKNWGNPTGNDVFPIKLPSGFLKRFPLISQRGL